MTLPQINKKEENGIDKKLSVQVSLDGLCFLITNRYTDAVQYFKEVQFPTTFHPEEVLVEIQNITENDPPFRYTFGQVTICHENNLYTLVPKAVFTEDAQAEYLKFNTKILPTDFITFDSLDLFDMVVVYVPYTNINNYFFEKYGSFTFNHSTTLFIEKTLKVAKNDSLTKIHVHIYHRRMDILVSLNKKVMLFNSFEYHTPEDLLYYILFTAEQLELDPDEFPLFLSGKIKTGDDYYSLAYEYVRNVEVIPTESPDETGIYTDEITNSHSLLFNN